MGWNIWLSEVRAPFLALPVIFVPLAVASAWVRGSFDPLNAILCLVGATMLHMSVNVLNDYFDYHSGIDLAAKPTPFSGGSGILPNGELQPKSVLIAGISFLAVGSLVGLYFVFISGFDMIIIGLLAVAVFSIVTYSSKLAAWGIGESIVGLNFGPMLFIGVHYLQTGSLSLEALLLGLVLGIMTTGILYINEFPDHDADADKGRRHIVVRLGKERAANVFQYIMAASYITIVLSVVLQIFPPLAIISLFTIPKARFAAKTLRANYDKVDEIIPAMANTVMTTILTGILLVISYLAYGFIVLII